ncbi:copper resistance protein B [Fodinibius salsisoli]|uniref:Copper resistance protein B n=1 Tax=Fodinibius salsisoli TaxID=2820877 RepID=A0ABT3PM29_9BACT|nr:copper resistance protein B [Fodinibius salsisoli]MCW9706224.1 copper resistance protein B [Fodinibius salsisoli]
MNSKQIRIIKSLSAGALLLMLIVAITSSPAKGQKAPEFSSDLLMDNQTYVFFMTDRFEYYHIGGGPIVLDAQGYIGKDLQKIWVEVEGEALTAETEGETELEALYGRAISAYFDLRAGIRYDIAYTADRTQSRGLAVVGIQGLAPYLFEVDGNLFVSQTGDVSAELEGEYDFPITQRLWGQPRVATSLAVQDVPRWGLGSGFNDVQLGLRLRYEIKRELAPYLGISWSRKLGETADFVREEGGDPSTIGLVGGLRMWF